MKGKRHRPEEIVQKLKAIEDDVATGASVTSICSKLGVSPSTYHRWKKLYGHETFGIGGKIEELARENERLKRALADLYLDCLLLQNAATSQLAAGSHNRLPWSTFN